MLDVAHENAQTCTELCAEPLTNEAAWLLLILDLCHLIPMELFLVVFYIIPRRFYLSGNEEEINIDI